MKGKVNPLVAVLVVLVLLGAITVIFLKSTQAPVGGAPLGPGGAMSAHAPAKPAQGGKK